jgi:TPR repeat protein
MICYLGSINLCPMKVTDYDQDLKLTRKWADSGNAHALYLLGIRQKEGWDEKPDSQRAYELFERAAKAGDADAQYEMGWLNEQHADYLQAQGHTAARVSEVRTLAREWYAKSAFLKNPFAIAKLGQIEFSGWFRPPNLEGAREYYDRGLSENPKHAGLHYLYGLLLKKQLEKAVSANDEASVATFRTQMLEHFKTSAEEGSPFACAQLGHLYLVGELVTQDYSTAYQHFTSATEKGLAWAHGPLGRMHEYGQGVPITPEEAAYHYRLAALAGNIDSALSLCRLYVGLGDLPCDSVRAMFWLDKLEKMGHPNPTFGVSGSAKEILAKALIRKGEYDTSVDFLNRLAKGPKEEQAIAYRNLSVLYANGWGVTKNTGTATSYRRKAIACGSNAAKCDQAIDLLQQGRNKEGLSLLDEASQAGEAEATYELALAYRRLGGATPSQITDLLIGAAKAGCVSAQLERAAQTISDVPGAPDVQEALRLVRAAAAEDNPEAIRLQVELLKRVPSREKTPEADSTRARSS